MAIKKNLSPSAFPDDLEGVFELLQEQRSSALVHAADVLKAARLLALEEARRLGQKAGPVDPRVTRYGNSAQAMQRRIAALDVEAEIASIRVPTVTGTETLLHGRVTDDAARAVAHVQVVLLDDAGKPLAGVTPVETDDAGYYKFILQSEQLGAAGSKRKLSLQVGNGSASLVPAQAQPFTLGSGRVAVSEVRLAGGELEKLRLRQIFPNLASDKPVSKAARPKAAPKHK